MRRMACLTAHAPRPYTHTHTHTHIHTHTHQKITNEAVETGLFYRRVPFNSFIMEMVDVAFADFVGNTSPTFALSSGINFRIVLLWSGEAFRMV